MRLAVAHQEDLTEGSATEALLVFVVWKGALYLFAIEF